MPISLSPQHVQSALEICDRIEARSGARVSTATVIPILPQEQRYKVLAITVSPLTTYQLGDSPAHLTFPPVGSAASFEAASWDLHQLLHGAGQAPQAIELWPFSLGIPVKGEARIRQLLSVANDHGNSSAKLHHARKHIGVARNSARPLSHIPHELAAIAYRTALATGYFGSLSYLSTEVEREPGRYPPLLTQYFRALENAAPQPQIDPLACATYARDLPLGRNRAGLATKAWNSVVNRIMYSAYEDAYPPHHPAEQREDFRP